MLEPSASDAAPANGRSLRTRVVSTARPVHEPDAPMNEPITFTSTYVGGGDAGYGRYTNPTWTAFEDALGDLEGGRALSYASGMAAIHAVLEIVSNDGAVVAPQHSYNGTVMALAELESRQRLRGVLVDITDPAAVERACDDAALLWLENPTNPALETIDLAELVRIGHDAGAHVVVDNTFATPLLQRPLEAGADIVVHSVTKYLAGHSDLLMGALVFADDAIADVFKNRRDLVGAVPGPMEAWLALRGLRTLDVRLERACANAATLADRLSQHPAISRVRYPGFGAIVSIELTDGPLAADLFTRATELWVHTTSLGGVESTLERRRRWKTEAATIPESLVRLSVGIEDVEDLWADLAQALP